MTRARLRAPASLAALGLGLVLLACATPPGTAPSVERKAWREALATLARDPAAGEAALRGFLAAHPESLLADDAGLRLAEIARADGRDAEAMAELRALLRAHPTGDRSDSARLLLARLEREAGDVERAYGTATRIRLSLLDPEERREAHRLLADLALERDDAAAALRWLARVRADRDDPAAAAVDAEIDALLADMDRAALRGAAEQLGRREPAARVRLRQAELALRAGDPDAARAALAAAAELPLGPGDAERLAALESALSRGALGTDLLAALPTFSEVEPWRVPDASLARGTLGVVLPLSGTYAAFGEESLQGVLLAAGLFDASRTGEGGVRVLVRDSAGRPDVAARAVGELAGDAAVDAVIGPLLADAAESAAPAAEVAGVPLLTLTRREEVAALGRHVLRLGSTPRLEARLVADYAARELGIERFAILYPDDAYGRALRAAFWDAVEARGARVVGVARYDVDANDFADPIRRLIGFEMLTGAERGALAERDRLLKRAKRLPPEAAAELREEAEAITGPGGRPLPPYVDFDAVFIPDAHEKVALIAPHLAFHEVRGVRLLGPGGWNHPDLVAIGGSHVNGAVFTASFYAESRFPFVAEFARRFRETFGTEPTFLAAQAFDAANLVLAQWVQGRTGREAVLEGLLATRGYPGASGVTTILPDGSAEKRPHLLGVDRGRIVSIDEIGEPPYLRPRHPVGPEDGGPG